MNEKGKTKKVKLSQKSWNESAIECIVKKKLIPGLYNVFIKPKEPKSLESVELVKAFTVMKPEIESLSPSEGSKGEPVVIDGDFFGTYRGKVFLEYTKDNCKTKKKKCKVNKEDWNMNSITFKVPGNIPSDTICSIIVKNKVDSVTKENVFMVK